MNIQSGLNFINIQLYHLSHLCINKFLWKRFPLSFDVMTQLYQDSLISTFRFGTDGLI